MIGQHLERLLRKQGYHALRLQSPVEALSLFPPKTPTDADNPTEEPASQTWSLIITDNAMPRVDGITFVKTLRERGFDTKVVMLTGHLPPPPETLQELDIETIIAKPINIKDFIKLIQEQLAQEPSSSI